MTAHESGAAAQIAELKLEITELQEMLAHVSKPSTGILEIGRAHV